MNLMHIMAKGKTYQEVERGSGRNPPQRRETKKNVLFF